MEHTTQKAKQPLQALDTHLGTQTSFHRHIQEAGRAVSEGPSCSQLSADRNHSHTGKQGRERQATSVLGFADNNVTSCWIPGGELIYMLFSFTVREHCLYCCCKVCLD